MTAEAVMTVAACTLAGLIVGSFLNVVIARVPAEESVVRPRSRCPRCGTPIAPRDNIPVVSWLLLRGRARCCGTPISVRYPLVEVATAAAFGIVTAWATGLWTPSLFGEDPAVMAADSLTPPAWHGARGRCRPSSISPPPGIALARIDLDTHRFPFWIVVPSWWVAGVLLGGAALLMGTPSRSAGPRRGSRALGLLPARPRRLPARDGLRRRPARRPARAVPRLARLGCAGGRRPSSASSSAARRRGDRRRGPDGGLKTEIPYGPYMLVGAWLGAVWGPAARQRLPPHRRPRLTHPSRPATSRVCPLNPGEAA